MMLDAFIIEQLRRERKERPGQQVPLELPLPSAGNRLPLPPEDKALPDRDRGVVIIGTDGVTRRL